MTMVMVSVKTMGVAMVEFAVMTMMVPAGHGNRVSNEGSQKNEGRENRLFHAGTYGSLESIVLVPFFVPSPTSKELFSKISRLGRAIKATGEKQSRRVQPQ
jgi:hypothetical protein